MSDPPLASARLQLLAGGAPVTLVVHHGCVTLQSDDDAAFDTVSEWISARLMVEGKGFARLARNAAGALVRDAERGGPVVEGYVGLDAGDEEVLRALRDGLEASGAFELLA